MAGGLLRAYEGSTIDEFERLATTFLHETEHPTLRRPYVGCGFRPMVELLHYFTAHEFSCYIASGGGRDFMRTVSEECYGVPPERVIGSSNGLRFQEDDADGGSIVYLAEPDVFDDGPVKPIRIWSRTGRRPLLVAGNANGDIPALRFAGGPQRPALRVVVRHDDAEREFDYTAGAETALAMADAHGWTVASVRDDWATVFG